jgi:hypothetical protein
MGWSLGLGGRTRLDEAETASGIDCCNLTTKPRCMHVVYVLRGVIALPLGGIPSLKHRWSTVLEVPAQKVRRQVIMPL